MKFVHFPSIYQQSCQYAKRRQLTKITILFDYYPNLNSRISATFLPTIFTSAYFSLTLPSPIFDLNRMNLKKKVKDHSIRMAPTPFSSSSFSTDAEPRDSRRPALRSDLNPMSLAS